MFPQLAEKPGKLEKPEKPEIGCWPCWVQKKRKATRAMVAWEKCILMID